jgi:hypothetical protein
MNCSYHPEVQSQEMCTACKKPLCSECAHKIKNKFYCQDCLIKGAEWATTVRDLRIPTESPKRAALCALIPGMGAVYNNEYLKAITYFAVFAALSTMGDSVHGIFGFGAFAFLVFTMFDAYRTAEAHTRKHLESGTNPEKSPQNEKTIIAWGIILIILGFLFLLRNIIPYDFLHQLWPLIFVLLGGYLVYRSIRERDDRPASDQLKPNDIQSKEG